MASDILRASFVNVANCDCMKDVVLFFVRHPDGTDWDCVTDAGCNGANTLQWSITDEGGGNWKLHEISEELNATEPFPLTFTLGTYVPPYCGSTLAGFQVKVEEADEICRFAASSWVLQYCFREALEVTFKHRRHGWVTCRYPGTTIDDFTRMVAWDSKGRYVWQFLYYRPYVIVPTVF